MLRIRTRGRGGRGVTPPPPWQTRRPGVSEARRVKTSSRSPSRPLNPDPTDWIHGAARTRCGSAPSADHQDQRRELQLMWVRQMGAAPRCSRRARLQRFSYVRRLGARQPTVLTGVCLAVSAKVITTGHVLPQPSRGLGDIDDKIIVPTTDAPWRARSRAARCLDQIAGLQARIPLYVAPLVAKGRSSRMTWCERYTNFIVSSRRTTGAAISVETSPVQRPYDPSDT